MRCSWLGSRGAAGIAANRDLVHGAANLFYLLAAAREVWKAETDAD
jgi:hypothetical protein